MPTVLQDGPYRFFFYSNEGSEPSHIHFQRDSKIAKFWLDPISLENSGGFSTHELSKLFRLVYENEYFLKEAWNEHFCD